MVVWALTLRLGPRTGFLRSSVSLGVGLGDALLSSFLAVSGGEVDVAGLFDSWSAASLP